MWFHEIIETPCDELWWSSRAREDISYAQDWGHNTVGTPTDAMLLDLIGRCGYRPRGPIQRHSRLAVTVPIE